MRCEKCGYEMDALDRECRRCHLRPGQMDPDQADDSGEPDVAEEELAPAMEPRPARRWAQPTLVGAALGASIVSRSLYPSAWAYVIWVPAALLGLWCGHAMVVRARPVSPASDAASAGPQWRFGVLLLITVMLALNFPAANRHVEDPAVEVNVTQAGWALIRGWNGYPAESHSGYQPATATLPNQPQYQEYMRKAAEARALAEKYENLSLDESQEVLALQERQKAALAAPAALQAARERTRAADPMPKSGGQQEKEAEDEMLQQQRDSQEAQALCLQLQADIVEHLHKAEEYKAQAKQAWDDSTQNLTMARQVAQ